MKISYPKLIPIVALDIIASTLSLLGLIYLPGSIFDMLFGLELVLVAVASKIFLKMAVSRNQWLGVGFVLVGFLLVGLAGIIFDNNEDVTV